MALKLHIPPCIKNPVHPNHLPSAEKPLRIQIEGPFTSVQKLVPEAQDHITVWDHVYPQPAGPLLARLAFEQLYARQPGNIPGELVVRNEYLGWVMEDKKHLNKIDYYGVTFDHLVPAHDEDPEVLQINIIEMDYDEGAYADEALPFKVDPADHTGRSVLAVPRCCQKRKGTQDRERINVEVLDRDAKVRANQESTKEVAGISAK